MKIIILAAGKGERLMPLTRNTPKPLLDMGNGRTLLEEQLERIRESGVVDEAVLVIGYLGEQVETKIRTIVDGIKIRTMFNPFYDMSNNLATLWLAQHEMNEDFLVTNGDNLFTADVFAGLVGETGDGIFLSVSVKDNYDDEDMKVILQDNLVVKVSKIISSGYADAESPGLALVRGARARKVFRDHLDMLVRDRKYLNGFWLEVFNSIYAHGGTVYPWEFDGSTSWQEVDFHIDLDRAKELLHVSL